MAFVHGKNTVFKVDDSGGTLRTISAYVTSVDFPQTADTAETTAFGSTNKSYVAGVKDATVSIEGIWDPTVDGYLYGIVGQTVSIEYGPEGATALDKKYTCEAICTNYTPPSSIDDAVKFSAEFQVSGAVTRGAYT
jgi:hypothetical protein